MRERGYTFNASLQEWEPSSACVGVGAARLTCLTWNVWFGDYGFAERAQGLLQELEERKADLIALQEVTAPLLRLLTSAPWVQRDYVLSNIDPQSMGDYGLLILSRRPPRGFRRLPLPSGMNRYALLAEFDTPNGRAAVATVHLESMSFNAPVRQQQLVAIFDALEVYPKAIVLGDFNFCSSWSRENGNLDPRYVDLWAHLHPQEPGFTEDTQINTMRLARTRKSKQVRFDRVLLRDETLRWSAAAIDLVGLRPLGPELFISDHFGLLASLVARPSDDQHLLMLGQDHPEYGAISCGVLGAAHAFLSVGADAKSPSLAYKADKSRPNEDALLIKRRDNLYLLAVADSHFGVEASHQLLRRLAERDLPETRLDLLKLCLEIQRPHEEASSGTTLIVALYDAGSGHVQALATGDSTLATLGGQGWQVRNRHDSEYVRLDGLSYPDRWDEIELTLQPEELLVLHTDGIDECHYRKPETSVRPCHITELWETSRESAEEGRVRRFAASVVRAALSGVDGHPGGQDNIALVALQHRAAPASGDQPG